MLFIVFCAIVLVFRIADYPIVFYAIVLVSGIVDSIVRMVAHFLFFSFSLGFKSAGNYHVCELVCFSTTCIS